MTEEEAKTKWCPFARGTAMQGYHTCRGSQCMAWRTVVTHGPTLRRGEPAPDGMTAIMGNDEVTCYAQIDNYCGLAGKP